MTDDANTPGKPGDEPPALPGKLPLELIAVFACQLVLVAGLVQLDRIFSLGGYLHALVGLVFIFLPVFVLDRRGKPYKRYGLTFGKPKSLGIDLLFVLGAIAICFPPIVLGAPTFWGIGERVWSFAWPEGYPGVALSHLLVVALPEEFFYRGYLMGRLDDIFRGRINLLGARVGWSLLIQAALFAVGHFLVDLNPERLGVFFPALAFGWLRARRGSIVAPVAFHAAANVFMEVFRAGYGLQ
ncbi:MAG: CPBP family intramembrane metalloprotease [Deltaproteobacteria bacterium]|nr:CPBP family intramembrane metalloprotease [Deltaproteobacteria bacterium]